MLRHEYWQGCTATAQQLPSLFHPHPRLTLVTIFPFGPVGIFFSPTERNTGADSWPSSWVMKIFPSAPLPEEGHQDWAPKWEFLGVWTATNWAFTRVRRWGPNCTAMAWVKVHKKITRIAQSELNLTKLMWLAADFQLYTQHSQSSTDYISIVVGVQEENPLFFP